LGARALGQALVEKSLHLTAEDGSTWDASVVRVVGAFVLDMIGHNNNHDRDVFQIASGEGAGSARLALHAHLANQRWNHQAAGSSPGAAGPGPRAAHARRQARAAALRALARGRRGCGSNGSRARRCYNTDGQIFSDLGIPVVLFMENYDINRTGYHDTDDTMKNIDLDYASAVAAIAIESLAAVAIEKQ